MADAPGTGSDHWAAIGADRVWIREHAEWRRELCTPFGTAGGPNNDMRFKSTRITTGVTESGKRFQIHDMWTSPQVAHRMLDEKWVGTTAFEMKYSNGVPMAQSRQVISQIIQGVTGAKRFTGSLSRMAPSITSSTAISDLTSSTALSDLTSSTALSSQDLVSTLSVTNSSEGATGG